MATSYIDVNKSTFSLKTDMVFIVLSLIAWRLQVMGRGVSHGNPQVLEKAPPNIDGIEAVRLLIAHEMFQDLENLERFSNYNIGFSVPMDGFICDELSRSALRHILREIADELREDLDGSFDVICFYDYLYHGDARLAEYSWYREWRPYRIQKKRLILRFVCLFIEGVFVGEPPFPSCQVDFSKFFEEGDEPYFLLGDATWLAGSIERCIPHLPSVTLDGQRRVERRV